MTDNSEKTAKVSEQDVQTLRKFAEKSLQDTKMSEVMDKTPSIIQRGAVYLIGGALLLTWALLYFGKVPVTIEAKGKIVPKGKAFSVQASESGVVTEVLVKVGDRLPKGAPLLRLDRSQSSSNLNMASEIKLKRQKIDLMRKDKIVIVSNLKQKKQDIVKKKKNLDEFRKMVEKGIFSEQELYQEEEGYRSTVSSVEQTRKQSDELDLNISNERLLLADMQLKMILVDILMPIAGTIVKLEVENPGERISAGKVVASVAPDGEPLVVNAAVPNKDIGFVNEGLEARIKVDAFPFQQFGVIPARVLQVFPNVGDSENFTITLELLRDHILVGDRKIPLFSGLTVTAELITRKQRLINLILGKDKDKKGKKGKGN